MLKIMGKKILSKPMLLHMATKYILIALVNKLMVFMVSLFLNASTYLKHLYTNGFFLLVLYNKLGIIHCTYLGVSGYN